MRCRKHHYVYTQGYFYCTKCGHRRYSGSYRGRKRTKKIGIGLGLTVGIIVIGFFVYQNSDTITQQIQNQIPKIDIPQISIPQADTPPIPVPYIPSRIDTTVTHGGSVTTTTDEQGRKIIIVKEEVNYGGNKLVIPEFEQQIHTLINNERTKQGLTPLVYDNKIATVARQHSEDMATRNYFEHVTPEGLSAAQRGINAGYSLCGDRQAIKDNQEYDRLSAEYDKLPRTTSSEAEYQHSMMMYNQLQSLYNKVNAEIQKGMIFEGFPENIFQNNLYDSYTSYGVYTTYDWNTPDEIARSTVDGWMNSAGHRENILTPYYYSEGIGVAISSDNKVLITQDFC